MNKQYEAIVNYSNAKWVSCAQMKKELGITNLANTLNELSVRRNICLEVMHDNQGMPARYRAYRIEKRGFIELAKYRKSLGPTGAPESFVFGGVL